MKLAAFCSLVCLSWLSVVPASAQDTTTPVAAPTSSPPSVAAPAAAPDVVRLSNGGFLRGTVQEYVPGEYVILVSTSGETKRIDAKEVVYAGPAAQDPGARTAVTAPAPEPAAPLSGAVKPLVTVQGQEARIHFVRQAIPKVPDQSESLTLYLRTGSSTAVASNGVSAVADSFTTVCASPCDAVLPAGSYTLALGQGNRPAVKAPDLVKLPAGSSTLAASYRSRATMRVGGWILLVGGTVAGTLLITTGLSADAPGPPVLAGGALALGGLIVGLMLGTRSDVVQFTAK